MEPPSPHRVHVLDDSGLGLPTDALEAALRAALADLGIPAGELSVRLTTDEEMRRLNREGRGEDQPTDVLTFPPGDFPWEDALARPLGDLAISGPQALLQAQARGIAPAEELAYLGLHGALHLAGLDDETEEEREHMIGQMARLGKLAGLPEVADWHTMAPAGGPA
jgi:probable rRNA maturation factor